MRFLRTLASVQKFTLPISDFPQFPESSQRE